MADYAIGLSFHKAHRTLVRVAELSGACRYFASRSEAGLITLPTLDTGREYVELQTVRQGSFQISDNDTDFRLLGDDGWMDSVITGSRVQTSVTTYFSKAVEIPAGSVCPIFTGNYNLGFELIQRARDNKSYEIYFEFLKELGQANGDEGDWYYDFTGFNGVISNYQEQMNAEGLTEVSFELKSRGRPVFGRYNAGSTALVFGQAQSSMLDTAPSSGTRRYASVPANNASAVVVSANATVTYTSDGTVALDELSLPNSGAGFYIENASTGAIIPAVVTLGGAGNNVVTINPVSNLAAATIHRLIGLDGAIRQSVDGLGVASPTGVQRPLKGFVHSFLTA